MSLLRTRRFFPLFMAQTLGAFNDNAMKNALVMLITYRLAADNPGQAQTLVTLASGIFILPYLLFSAVAGQLADRYDRARMARATKLAEVVIMVIAAIGFVSGHTSFLLFVLFCLGIQAAFFSPIKYALLPQHLRSHELLQGNAYIEAGMFLAILLGTIIGGLLVLYPGGVYWISSLIIACALGGYAASRAIPDAKAPCPDIEITWNLAADSWHMIKHDKENPAVFICMLAISWFWLVGATFLSQFPAFAKDVLAGDETVVTLFLSAFSIGIAAGSMLCNWLLRGRISCRLVPMGALGMSAFGAHLFFASHGLPPAISDTLISAGAFLHTPHGLSIFVDLCGFAICAGLFIVPLYAVLQERSDKRTAARTIASCNILNALGMVLASGLTLGLLKAGLSTPDILLLVSLATGMLALLFYSTLKKLA